MTVSIEVNTLGFDPGERGAVPRQSTTVMLAVSISEKLTLPQNFGSVTQLALEYHTFNVGVVGSSPTRSTNGQIAQSVRATDS